MYKLIFLQEWTKSSWEHLCDKLDNNKMRIEIKIWESVPFLNITYMI